MKMFKILDNYREVIGAFIVCCISGASFIVYLLKVDTIFSSFNFGMLLLSIWWFIVAIERTCR